MQSQSEADFPTTSTKILVADPQQALDLHYGRIRLTAHHIARLRILAYRDCPRQTLPPLQSLQRPLSLKKLHDERPSI
jgi:hypothetical protein